MATTALSGKSGSITGGGGASEITQWNSNIEIDMLDATSMASSGFREYIAGLQGCTGSFTAIGTKPTASTTSASLSLLTSAGGVTISGTAFIHSVAVTSDVADKVVWTANFTFTGSFTVS